MKTTTKFFIFCALYLGLMQTCLAQKNKTTSQSSEETTSVSISEGDDYYTFSASFNPNKNERIKANIIEKYGQDNNGNWDLGNEANINLRKGHLSMRIDKADNNSPQMTKMHDLGEKIQALLNVPQTPAVEE